VGVHVSDVLFGAIVFSLKRVLLKQTSFANPILGAS